MVHKMLEITNVPTGSTSLSRCLSRMLTRFIRRKSAYSIAQKAVSSLAVTLVS